MSQLRRGGGWPEHDLSLDYMNLAKYTPIPPLYQLVSIHSFFRLYTIAEILLSS